MDNQHRKILGYRELTQEEIDLMNEIKAMGAGIGALVQKVEAFNDARWKGNMKDIEVNFETYLDPDAPEDAQYKDPVLAHHIIAAQPGRWVRIAQTDLQQGLMALTRAVAMPTFF